MPRVTKLQVLYENRFLPNRELALLLYGEVNPKTLARVKALKYVLKRKLLFYAPGENAYIPVKSTPQPVSFNDLAHYEIVTPFRHDDTSDLNLRYLADVARFVNARTLKDQRFEVLLFNYLQFYLPLFERNPKGNIKLYLDTNKGALRGHHKNKALLYYLIIIIYCRHYRCPSKEGRDAIKSVIFNEHEDADDILDFYRPQFVDVIARELFL